MYCLFKYVIMIFNVYVAKLPLFYILLMSVNIVLRLLLYLHYT